MIPIHRTPTSRVAHLLPLLAMVLVAACSRSGGGAPTFAKSYGGDAVDFAADAVETPDGGYVFVGTFNGRRLADQLVDEDLWVTKTDAYGDLEWSRVYSQNQTSVGTAANETSYTIATERRGGGYYLVGTVDDLGPLEGYAESPEDVGVARLDANGNTLWSMAFGMASMPTYPLTDVEVTPSERPLGVHPTDDGGLLVAGHARAPVLVNGTSVVVLMPFVMRIDHNGNTVWQRHLDNEGYELAGSKRGAMHVRETSDGGVVVGYSGEFDPGELGEVEGDLAARFTRLDVSGTLLWSTRIDEIELDDLEVFDRTSVGDDDSLLIAALEHDLISSSDPELIVLDSFGNEVAREDITSDIGDIEQVEAMTPQGSSEEVFLVAGDSWDSFFGPHAYRVCVFDKDLNRIGSLEYPSSFESLDARPVGPTLAGFEILTTTYDDAATKTGHVARVHVDTTGGPLDYAHLPIPIDARHHRRFSDGRVPAGWVDGSDQIWTWRPRNVEDLTEGFELAVHDDAGELWSRTFAGSLNRRVEHGLQVEVLQHAEDPKGWELAVLGEIAYEPGGGPPPPGARLVPWVLRIDRDGELLSQKALWGARLSFTGPSFAFGDTNIPHEARLLGARSSRTLAVAANGDLLLGAEVSGLMRIVRLDRDGNVLSISSGLFPVEQKINAIAATSDGGAVAVGSWYITRVDAAGTVAWRKTTPAVGGVAELPDGTLAFGTTAPSIFGPTRYGILHTDAAGETIDSVFLANDALGVHGSETHVVARADGGVVMAVGLLLSYEQLIGELSPGTWIWQIVSVDAGLQPQWSQTYGGLLDESIGGFHLTSDGGLLVAGHSRSLADSPEAWVLRTDSAGGITTDCPAAIARVEPLFGLYDDVTSYTGDGVLGSPPTNPPVVTAYATAAVPTTVTQSVVVARQCGGASDDPPAGTARLEVVIEAGSGQVIQLVDGGGQPLIDCPGTCSADVPLGTVIELYAAPATGFGTGTWSGGDCGPVTSTQCSVTMDGDRTVSVSFPSEGELFDLTIEFLGAGSGSVSIQPLFLECSDTCTQVDIASSGDTFNLIASPDAGSTFGGWTGVDLDKGLFAQVAFSDSDRTVTVRFD